MKLTISPELAGHLKMCVRMKLRKDERELKSKPDQIGVAKRVQRGQSALHILTGKSDDNGSNEKT